MTAWTNWVLNLDFKTQPCYSPVLHNDEVLVEMTVVKNCPGKLVGVYSLDSDRLHQFLRENPEWQ